MSALEVQLSELAPLQSEWNTLLARSGTDTIFLTYEWITAWLRWIGREAEPLVLVARERTGELRGIAPLMITTADGQRQIEFIGTPNSDYSDFIVAGDRVPVLRAFFSYLFGRPRAWARMTLREIAEDSPTLPAMLRLGARRRFPAMPLPGELCPTLLLGQAEADIRDELARKKYIGKRNWQKSVQYAQTLGEVEFSHAQEISDAKALLGHLFRLHRERWSADSKFQRQDYERFYDELLVRLWPHRQVAVSAMTIDDRPIAVSFAFPYKRKWTNHTWVHDRQHAKLSAGTLLVHFLVQSALDEGFDEFDLTRGAEQYKQRFSNKVRQNTDLIVYGRRREYLALRTGDLVRRGRTELARVSPSKRRYTRASVTSDRTSTLDVRLTLR